MSALIPGGSAKLPCLVVSPWRMLTNSSTSARCSSQTARVPWRSEAGLILLVPHSLACNPVFGRGVKYRCMPRAGSSDLLYACETWPVRVADERIMEVFDNDSICHILRGRLRDCVPSVELRRPTLPYEFIGTARAKKAPLVWLCCKTSYGELNKELLLTIPTRTWCRRSLRLAEDVGDHDQYIHGTALRTTNLRPRTIEKVLEESF